MSIGSSIKNTYVYNDILYSLNLEFELPDSELTNALFVEAKDEALLGLLILKILTAKRISW